MTDSHSPEANQQISLANIDNADTKIKMICNAVSNVLTGNYLDLGEKSVNPEACEDEQRAISATPSVKSPITLMTSAAAKEDTTINPESEVELSSSKHMMIQKLLKDLNSKKQVDIRPSEGGDVTVAHDLLPEEPPRRDKITYSITELRELNPFLSKARGDQVPSDNRVHIGNLDRTREPYAANTTRNMPPTNIAPPKPTCERRRIIEEQAMTSAVATPKELEVLTALSNRSAEQSIATESVHSDNTIDSNDADNLKARLLQRSKSIQAKMRNLTKK